MKAKDYASDQEVRWCPGCGDYSILKQTQTVMAQLELAPENTVFISGIGCSSRFPYYMNTYGMHSIHGRAPAVATGLKVARPDLDVWLITGDGDALSIGGNHTIHMLRRNLNLNVLLFNNQIYGLTKGQYSPTSELGKVTKSTPFGSLDQPFNPLLLAHGAGASFIARSVDRNPSHLKEILTEGHKHRGTGFIEIYQNCNVFNDGAFHVYTDKSSKEDTGLYLEEGQPLIFGKEMSRGIILDGLVPRVVDMDDHSKDDLWVHDPTDHTKAYLLTKFFDDQTVNPEGSLPRPFGIFFRDSERPCYEDLVLTQNEEASLKGKPDLDGLIAGRDTWTVE